MGKLIIPHANERERTAMSRAGITLIENISEQDFLNIIKDFLNQHNVLHLSTCRDNTPRCTPLEYFNNGLTVYILSEGGGKIANLKANPQVAYGISDPYHPHEDFFGASGLQVWGTAAFFKKNTDPERFRKIITYSRAIKELKQQGLEQAIESLNFNVITIEPIKIRYLCYRKGFRNIVWKKDA